MLCRPDNEGTTHPAGIRTQRRCVFSPRASYCRWGPLDTMRAWPQRGETFPRRWIDLWMGEKWREQCGGRESLSNGLSSSSYSWRRWMPTVKWPLWIRSEWNGFELDIEWVLVRWRFCEYWLVIILVDRLYGVSNAGKMPSGLWYRVFA